MANTSEQIYGNVKVVRNGSYKWGVTDLDGNVIVPFGKYAWIDGFERGLARVRGLGQLHYFKNVILTIGDNNEVTTDPDRIRQLNEEEYKAHPERFSKWGIINEKGEEVLPVEYEEIWNFVGKNYDTIVVKKNGIEQKIFFHDLNPSLPKSDISSRRNTGSFDDYGRNYDEYAGSYAQDVMGYSDDVINDAFDGDADAYWNID